MFSPGLTPSNLSYPNVSFRETIAGPLPIEMGYRNTIGVVGVFSRGPEGPVEINSRAEAFYLFGEDDSPGSIFLKQAMYTGASKFIVSRVVPTSRPAGTVISLQSKFNPEVQEAYVANSTRRRTVGLSLEMDYVSPIITRIGGFSTEPVEIAPESAVELNMEGNGILQFEVVELLQATGAEASGGLTTSVLGNYLQDVTDPEILQVISFSYNEESFVNQYVKPGRFLQLVPSASVTVQQRNYVANSVVTDCIDAAEGLIFLPNVPDLASGQIVRVSSSGTLPAGLDSKRYYWVRLHPQNVISLHTSYEGATGQITGLDKVVFGNVGTGNLTLHPHSLVVQQRDASATVTADTLSLADSSIILGTSDTDALAWPLTTGDKVRVSSSGTLPTGLAANTDYYVRVDSTLPQKITLHSTRAGALNDTAKVTFTAVGTGELTVTLQPPTFEVDNQNNRLEVISYPFYQEGLPSVVVRGKVSKQSTAWRVKVLEPSYLNNIPYYTFLVGYRPVDSVSPSDLYTLTSPDRQEVVNVMRVGRRNRNWIDVHVFTPVPGNPRLCRSKFSGVRLRFGKSNEVGNLDFIPKDNFGIGLIKGRVTVGQYVDDSPNNDQRFDANLISTINAFPPGLSSAEILQQLAKEIQSSPFLTQLVEDVEVSVNQPPYFIAMRTKFGGVAANRVRYRVKRHWVNVDGTPSNPNPPDDIMVGPYLNTNIEGALNNVYMRFVGGSDPMFYASRVLYDNTGRPLILIKALSPGRQGNQIRFSVRPGSRGMWLLEVHDDSVNSDGTRIPSESYTMNNFTVDPQTGEFMETLESRLVRVFFIPQVEAGGTPIPNEIYNLLPMRLAPPVSDVVEQNDPKHVAHRGFNFLRNIYLTGGKDPDGYDPQNPEERDFTAAVRRLEQSDVAILSLAGVHIQDARYEEAISEAVLQANNSSTINGLRVVVLQAPPAMTASRAASVANMTTRSERVVVVSGYVTMAGYRHLGVNRVPSNGYYCGLLAMTQPHYSPAAVSVTPPLVGILSCDTKNSPELLDAITRNGIEALYYDPGLRQFKFLNGVTSSLDPKLRFICVRRMADQMITDLSAALQWVRSMPHTAELRRLVASGVDAYLRQLLRDQRIFGFRPTICDESNNTPLDMSRGIMNISICYTPVFPADFIRVDLVRDITTTFSVITAASNSPA